MKDYYQILELPTDASEEQIRKSYRRLALKFHPDHNPGDPSAEERFKEIAEAYGVLIDPAKRVQYDQWRRAGPQERRAAGGFQYSQEEIFQDLFRDPRFSRVFQDLFSEFEKAGFRSDQSFFDQMFFGGRGVFFGGIFIWGPFGSKRMRIHRPRRRAHVEKSQAPQIQPFSFLKRLGQKIGGFLLGKKKAIPHQAQSVATQPQDLTYNLTLPAEDAQRGTWVTISLDRGQGQERLKVRIPPGTQSGKRLRLKGKGIHHGNGSGDLYLTVNVA